MRGGVLGEADPKVAVHGQLHPGIQPADLLVKAAAPKRGGLRKEVVVVHPDEPVEGDLSLKPERSAVGVDPEAVAVDHLPVGMFNKDLGHLVQGPGFVQVVGAQPAEDVAGRAVEALYERVGLALVRLANPVRDICSEYRSMISTVSSVEPPSMMMYSRLG